MRQPYNGWAVGLSYHGSLILFIPALQMLIFTPSELQIRKNGVNLNQEMTNSWQHKQKCRKYWIFLCFFALNNLIME
jgi:prolipoprotein diacylglyceryltransferase